MIRVIIRYGGIALLSLIIAILTAWSSMAIFYSNLPGSTLRPALSAIFPVLVITAFIFLPRRRLTVMGFFVVFLFICAWWTWIPASHNRVWEKEVARAPYATIKGNLVTVHNIRNFTYRTEKDFDSHHYDKTFDLEKLDSVDLIAVYWMGDAIAHIMMSFGFEGKDYLAFSIETRKEQGEEYSTIKGFFKQYELIYIAGDERDLIRVRTDFRNPQEDVYVYRLKGAPERGRKLFMEYIHQINRMKEKPEWYNTLTTNCTTNIVQHVRAFGGRVRYNWKILLSGYAPRYTYEIGLLDTNIPFEELKKRSHINIKAHEAGNSFEFSRIIRKGLPLSQ
jgi:hypothetical protein